jgi:nucleoside phosphorylase
MRHPAILAPTLLEYVVAKCALPDADVVWSGVGLTRLRRWDRARLYVICGLAGGLAPDTRPGTLLVPARVGLADGRFFDCDGGAVEALHTALRRAHTPFDARPILTADRMMVGRARRPWAARGFVGVDMETGKPARAGARVATVRVVLDSADHEISAEWEQPLRALRRSSAWKELFWLARMGPYYAWTAARALKLGLGLLSMDRLR